MKLPMLYKNRYLMSEYVRQSGFDSTFTGYNDLPEKVRIRSFNSNIDGDAFDEIGYKMASKPDCLAILIPEKRVCQFVHPIDLIEETVEVISHGQPWWYQLKQ